MYINFHKFNYSLIPTTELNRYEERDREAYKIVLKDWFNSNIDSFVDRKWEIEEIYYLKEVSDFIKLVREAESLYELGFFTGCIALVGVSSEDFSKYLSLKNNLPTHITDVHQTGKRKGQTFDVTQHERLKLQLNENVINQNTYDLLDEIRRIRNDCLHYNQTFKQKATDDLKIDALKALNNLKSILQTTIGTEIDPLDAQKLMDELCQNEHHRSFEDIVWKQRNMISHLLKFSTVQDPNVKQIIKANFFKVTDLDDEIELTELEVNPQAGMKLLFYVDIGDNEKRLISEKSIGIDDVVFAKIYSNVAKNGQTELWYIREIEKIIS